MEWVETVAGTVRAAIDQALDELGVDEQDAEFVIVEEPRSGLLGIRRGEARVRARVRPTAPRPKRPQRSRRNDSRSGGSRERPRAESTEQKKEKSASVASSAEDGAVDSSATDSNTNSSAFASTGSSTRRRQGGKPRRAAQSNAEGKTSASSNGGTEEVQMSMEQQETLVGEFVRGVVERFGFDASTTVRSDEDHIFVDVTGEDLGLLVGPRGSTLDAFQELTRTVIQRRSDEHTARIVVDVAGFRAKRAAALQAFVERIAAEVIASGEAQALEPMSPADRKIVHDTASAIDGVATTSEGLDPRRFVVIRPADTNEGTDETEVQAADA